MNFEKQDKNEPEKPKKLFHGSPFRDLDNFNPSDRTLTRNQKKAYVFASPDKNYASMYLFPWDDSWAHMLRVDNTYHLVLGDRKKFEELDKGGSLYELPISSFENNEDIGGEKEWISEESVKPSGVKKYDSAIDAMKEHGIKIYFVDKDTLEKIKKADDKGESIIKTLSPEA